LKLGGFIVFIVFGAVLSVILSNVLSAVVPEASAQQQIIPNTNISSSPGVKISSPAKGQQVPIGILTISGTSTDDPVHNCQVSVLLNGIKPYQRTNATGQSSGEVSRANDYSTWKYTFTPSYAVIKEGINKITSKISCSPVNSPTSLNKWYSVNVTGNVNAKIQQVVQPSLPSKIVTAAAIAPLQKDNTGLKKETIPTTTGQQITTGTTSPTPSIPLNALYNNNNTPKLLTLSLDVTKDPIKRGSKETVITEVSDTTSKEKIRGAKVVGKVTSMSGGAVKESFEGTTDNDGQTSYSWKIGENGKSTKYKVTAQASAAGYQDVTSSTSFKVKPATIITSKNDHTSNDAGSSSSHESRNIHNNNNFKRVTVDSGSNENDQNNNNNFEDSKIESSWNGNHNNDHSNNNNFERVTIDSGSNENDQNNNNNNFGEAMTDNINDFTHEIINGVNDMIRIHIR
jgi:hypothetical protein